MIRFGKHGKVNQRYPRPFEILATIVLVAYKLPIPQELSNIHPTFPVSNLKKCLSNETLVVLLNEIEVNESLHYIEETVEIIDKEIEITKQCRIPIVKDRWNAKRGPEFTSEPEDQLKQKYPQLFC